MKAAFARQAEMSALMELQKYCLFAAVMRLKHGLSCRKRVTHTGAAIISIPQVASCTQHMFAFCIFALAALTCFNLHALLQVLCRTAILQLSSLQRTAVTTWLNASGDINSAQSR